MKAEKMAKCERAQLVWSQVGLALKNDKLNWLVFYASFVNQMMKEELGTIITIWLAFFVMSAHEQEQAAESGGSIGQSMSQEECDDTNQNINLIGQVASFCSVPVFGFITDKLSTGNELMFAYGLRGLCALAFFMTESPKDMHVVATLVTMMLAANLEEVVIDSMYTKRMPKDVRAAMKSAQTSFGKLGHLFFVLFSLMAIGYWSIGQLMLVIAVFDFSVVIIALAVSLGSGFKEDVGHSKKIEEATKLLESRLLNITQQLKTQKATESDKKED